MTTPSIDEFPVTPEEFQFKFILCNSITRSHMVTWFKEMSRVFVNLDDPNRAILLHFSTILENSLESIIYLYEIQIADNMKFGLLPKVISDNKAYGNLRRSVLIWNQLETKLQYLIQLTPLPLQCEAYFGFLKGLNTNIRKDLMKSIAISEDLSIIFNDMYENLTDVLINITDCEASENSN